jgi:hypothetical protein
MTLQRAHNFHRTLQEAYTYWLRTVNSCLLAEWAYGPNVVFRLRYSDLVNTPKDALQDCFNFVGETFVSQSLNTFQTRLNSSDVPADFKINDSNVDPVLLEQATELSRPIEQSTAQADTSPARLMQSSSPSVNALNASRQ